MDKVGAATRVTTSGTLCRGWSASRRDSGAALRRPRPQGRRAHRPGEDTDRRDNEHTVPAGSPTGETPTTVTRPPLPRRGSRRPEAALLRGAAPIGPFSSRHPASSARRERPLAAGDASRRGRAPPVPALRSRAARALAGWCGCGRSRDAPRLRERGAERRQPGRPRTASAAGKVRPGEGGCLSSCASLASDAEGAAGSAEQRCRHGRSGERAGCRDAGGGRRRWAAAGRGRGRARSPTDPCRALRRGGPRAGPAVRWELRLPAPGWRRPAVPAGAAPWGDINPPPGAMALPLRSAASGGPPNAGPGVAVRGRRGWWLERRCRGSRRRRCPGPGCAPAGQRQRGRAPGLALGAIGAAALVLGGGLHFPSRKDCTRRCSRTPSGESHTAEGGSGGGGVAADWILKLLTQLAQRKVILK